VKTKRNSVGLMDLLNAQREHKKLFGFACLQLQLPSTTLCLTLGAEGASLERKKFNNPHGPSMN
jgi:hypothetical protein